MTKREQEEHAKLYQNRIIYSLPVHLGLWNEELALREEKSHIAAYKRDRCQLLVQKTKKMFRNVLKATVLALEAPYVLYGRNYQLKTCDVTAEGGFYLSGSVNERDIDAAPRFRHGCAVAGSPVKEPCVRNTFQLTGGHEEGRPVFYGDDVLLRIAASGGPALYVQCPNSTIDTFGGHPLLRLSEFPDIYCRFKIIHWNPQKRYETTGTTFRPDTRVVVQHTASGRNLAIEPARLVPSFHGPERVVSCHTYRDSHKMETAENFWKIVSRPISDTALYVRAAKGEDIPMENFE